MSTTLKLMVISLIITACASHSSQDTDQTQSREDIKHQMDTSQRTLIALVANSSNNDTLVVDKRVAVFIAPDSIKIEKQKKQVGEENFYTGADDYLFYMNTAHVFLDSVKLAILDVKGKKYIRFIRSDKTQNTINVDNLPELWGIYFFDPEKNAKQVDMTVIDEEYKSYFK